AAVASLVPAGQGALAHGLPRRQRVAGIRPVPRVPPARPTAPSARGERLARMAHRPDRRRLLDVGAKGALERPLLHADSERTRGHPEASRPAPTRHDVLRIRRHLRAALRAPFAPQLSYPARARATSARSA